MGIRPINEPAKYLIKLICRALKAKLVIVNGGKGETLKATMAHKFFFSILFLQDLRLSQI